MKSLPNWPHSIVIPSRRFPLSLWMWSSIRRSISVSITMFLSSWAYPSISIVSSAARLAERAHKFLNVATFEIPVAVEGLAVNGDGDVLVGEFVLIVSPQPCLAGQAVMEYCTIVVDHSMVAMLRASFMEIQIGAFSLGFNGRVEWFGIELFYNFPVQDPDDSLKYP